MQAHGVYSLADRDSLFSFCFEKMSQVSGSKCRSQALSCVILSASNCISCSLDLIWWHPITLPFQIKQVNGAVVNDVPRCSPAVWVFGPFEDAPAIPAALPNQILQTLYLYLEGNPMSVH